MVDEPQESAEIRESDIVFDCPHCGKSLAIDFRGAGQVVLTRTADEQARLKQALGDSGILGSWSPHGPFNNASLLVPLEMLYCLFLTDFEFYDRLMNFAMSRILDYTRAIDEAGSVCGNPLSSNEIARYGQRAQLPHETQYSKLGSEIFLTLVRAIKSVMGFGWAMPISSFIDRMPRLCIMKEVPDSSSWIIP